MHSGIPSGFDSLTGLQSRAVTDAEHRHSLQSGIVKPYWNLLKILSLHACKLDLELCGRETKEIWDTDTGEICGHYEYPIDKYILIPTGPEYADELEDYLHAPEKGWPEFWKSEPEESIESFFFRLGWIDEEGYPI